MDFPHAGDLMVISTVYPDGTVAALEELIGNHGGLGGEQTDAFLFHPPDLVVPPTRNVIDVFHILNGRRDQPVSADAAGDLTAAEPVVDAWSLGNLWGGLRDVHTWLPLAGRALVLDRSAYQEVVADQRMTAPALLLGPGLLAIYVLARGESPAAIPVQVAVWFLGILAIYAAGRLLADNGSYTRTLRGLGFANVITLLEMIRLIPALAPVAGPVGTLLSFVAIWMGAAAAHNAQGWRLLVLPILGFFFVVAAPLLVYSMLGGALFSLESLLTRLGFMP